MKKHTNKDHANKDNTGKGEVFPTYGVLILRRADGTFAFDTCALTLEQTILRSARKGETFTEARNRLFAAGWTVWLFHPTRAADMFHTFRTIKFPRCAPQPLAVSFEVSHYTSPLEGYEPLGPKVLRWFRERVWTPISEGIGRYGTRQLARWGISWEWKTEGEGEGEGKAEGEEH